MVKDQEFKVILELFRVFESLTKRQRDRFLS